MNNLRNERDQIERTITNITSHPFTKNKNGESSTVQRVGDLERLLEERQREAQKLKSEEQIKFNELNELKAKVQMLKGENEAIKKNHSDARTKFQEAHGEIGAGDVARDLFKMDQGKHKDALTDMYTRPDQQPVWKNYAFLERGDAQINMDDPKAIEMESTRIKHENKDLAAELDRA